MTTVYSDAFTGDGSLNGHVADGGMGTWGGTGYADLSIVGGKVVIPSDVNLYLDCINDGLLVDPGKVELSLDLAWPAIDPLVDSPIQVYFGFVTAGDFYFDLSGALAYVGGAGWIWISMGGGSSGYVPYADMPLDATPMRVGVEYLAAGTARLYTEPLVGGARTYRGVAFAYTPIVAGLLLRPWLAASNFTAPVAPGGSLDNFTLTLTPIVVGPSSPLTSTVAAVPATALADGVSTCSLTVQLKDVDGYDLTESDGVVTFAAPSSGAISAITDNGDGTWSAIYTAGVTVEVVTIAPALDGVPFTHTTTISVTPTSFYDNFIDVDGTNLPDHIPDSAMTGWVTAANPALFQIVDDMVRPAAGWKGTMSVVGLPGIARANVDAFVDLVCGEYLSGGVWIHGHRYGCMFGEFGGVGFTAIRVKAVRVDPSTVRLVIEEVKAGITVSASTITSTLPWAVGDKLRMGIRSELAGSTLTITGWTEPSGGGPTTEHGTLVIDETVPFWTSPAAQLSYFGLWFTFAVSDAVSAYDYFWCGDGVHPSAPSITLTPTSRAFAVAVSPVPQTVAVTNTGTGTLSGLAIGTIAYGSGGAGWLAAVLNTTTAPATVTLTPTLGTLAPGTYTATVPVTSSAAGVTNSPQNITVTYTVTTWFDAEFAPGIAWANGVPTPGTVWADAELTPGTVWVAA